MEFLDLSTTRCRTASLDSTRNSITRSAVEYFTRARCGVVHRASKREREGENEKEPLFLRGAVAETWPTRISRLFPVRVAAPIDSTLSISRIPSLRSCLLNYTAVLTFIAPASSSIYITSSNRVFLRKPRLSRSAGQYHYVRCK